MTEADRDSSSCDAGFVTKMDEKFVSNFKCFQFVTDFQDFQDFRILCAIYEYNLQIFIPDL